MIMEQAGILSMPSVFADSAPEIPYPEIPEKRECETGRETSMDIGYARVSTDDQRLDLQIDALLAAGIDRDWIYEEHVSGAKTKRPQLDACMKALRKDDVLVVWRLDRLGRSLRELIDVVERLGEKGIGFRSLTESIDTTTSGGRLIFHIFGAIAQFERDVISERTKAGLKAARARGARGGRKPKLSDKQVRMAMVMLNDPTTTHDNVAQTLGVSRATIYRAIQRVNWAEESMRIEAAKNRPKNRQAPGQRRGS